MIESTVLQMQQIEIAGQKAAQELAAAKKQYLQKIVSWQLPESKAKDVVFMVHAQLRRKQKRVQAFYVWLSSNHLLVQTGKHVWIPESFSILGVHM